MIGLRNLPDGGHVLVHPAGPIYVSVRRRKIAHAEIALWGSPYVVSWPASPVPDVASIWHRSLDGLAKGGGAAGQA